MQADDVQDMPVGGVIESLMAEGELLEGTAEAGLDGGEADAGSDAGDAGSGDEGADGAAAGGDEGGEGAAAGGEENGGSAEALTGSALWNALKEPLKALDPKLRNSVNRAIHKLAGIEKSFPEGVEKATATLQAVKQLAEDPATPTEKVIADTLAERNYFRELDAAYTEGKPEFIDKLLTAKPEAFDKLAPQIFQKYAETNPDGFSGFVARTVQQHMAQADVPLQFKILATFLPQLSDGPAKVQVIQAIEGIYGWSQALAALAAKQPAPVKAGEPKPGEKDPLATREQQVAEREQQVTLQSWNTEALQPGIRNVFSEADKYSATKKYKLHEGERRKVLAKVGEELDIRLAANKDYGKAMRGYLAAGNKQAFLQRLEAERKKLIPGAVRRAVDDVVTERPAKPAAKKAASVVKPGTQGQQQQAGADAGGEKLEWISGPPGALGLMVDLNRTSHAMLLKKRAYIKGRTTLSAWK